MPVSLGYWRARIGSNNCITFNLTHIPNETSHFMPSTIICFIRDWINIICSLTLLFVQILFLLSFIAIFSGPILIICSLLYDHHLCTLYQLTTVSVYISLVIVEHFPRPRDVRYLTIGILRCCFILLVICRMLLMLVGDIESNPRPKTFPCCMEFKPSTCQVWL